MLCETRKLDFILWMCFKKRSNMIRFGIYLIVVLRVLVVFFDGEGIFGDDGVDLFEVWLVRL